MHIKIKITEAPAGKKWCRLIDTNLKPPKDFTEGGNKGVDPIYSVQAYSSVVLIAKDK